MKTYAYVNHGRWIADCPFACGNSEQLYGAETRFIVKSNNFVCQNCGADAEIVWPVNASDIWNVLSMRHNQSNRNWYNAEHPLAVYLGLPHGQSVSELEQENLAHMVDAGVNVDEYLERFI